MAEHANNPAPTAAPDKGMYAQLRSTDRVAISKSVKQDRKRENPDTEQWQ